MNRHPHWAQQGPGPAYPYGPSDMSTGISVGSAFSAPSLQHGPPAQHASAPSFGSYVHHEPHPSTYAGPGRLHSHPPPHAHMPRGPPPPAYSTTATMRAHHQQPQYSYPGAAPMYGAPPSIHSALPPQQPLHHHPPPQRMGGPMTLDMNYPSHPQQHAHSYNHYLHQGSQHANPPQHHSAFQRPFFPSDAQGGPSSRCSSVTPASQVSTLTIDFQVPTSGSLTQQPSDCSILFPMHSHTGFPRHYTPAPFGFTSRTPSPDSIPAPPNLKAFPLAHSTQHKLPDPMAPRYADNALPVLTAHPVPTASGTVAVPLRETQRYNVKDAVPTHVSGVISNRTERNNLSEGRDKPQPIVTSDPSGKLSNSPVITSKLPSTGKPAVSVSDATLLLGLRTLSPAGTCTSQDTSLTPSLKADHGTITDNSTINTYDSSEVDPNKAQKVTSDAVGMRRERRLQQQQQLYIPENFPRRLALDGDDAQLNQLHCYIRRNLLEVFVVPKKEVTSDTVTTPSTNSSAGRVGLRCVHCAEARKTDPSGKNEAPMAVFYPRAVSEIYRLVTSWQRCHLRKCRNLPPSVRAEYETVRQAEKVRGKTSYWADSASEIGLVDCSTKAGGIRFQPPCENEEAGSF